MRRRHHDGHAAAITLICESCSTTFIGRAYQRFCSRDCYLASRSVAAKVSAPCECGCGSQAHPGRRFLQGHNHKVRDARPGMDFRREKPRVGLQNATKSQRIST